MKNLYKIITTVAFLLVLQIGKAQNVQISGHVSGFQPGSLVRVLVYSDQFSRLEKTLASVRTDLAGNFHFSFPLKKTTYAMLAVNLKRTVFFLKPGAVYHFSVTIDSAARNASPFEDVPLQVQLNARDDSLNAYIDRYNAVYNELIAQHFRDIFQYHNRAILQQFDARIKKQFASVKLPYVRQYIRYSLASLKWGARTVSLPEIVRTYFAGHPVLYQNIQYTNFFLDFFQSYFESTVQKPVSIDKLQQIIPQRSLKKLDELFRQAPALSSDARVRQLTEMVQLANCYSMPYFERKDIEALFRQIAASSPFPQNRQVAKNYLVKLNILQPGTPAPDFLLPDFSGKEYSLKNFRGKFVLLDFITTRCPVCNFQLKQLAVMQQNLMDFTIVTIVKGKVTSDFMQKVNPEGRNWPFLLLGNDILMLEKYQIVTYPAYVLIDPAGRISMAPAPMPDENLQQRLRSAINAYRKRVKN